MNANVRKQVIIGVDPGSPAQRCGIIPGDALLKVNGEPVLDLIDYTYLSAERVLRLSLLHEDGSSFETTVRKAEYEPLGLNFQTSLMSPVKSCANHCVFCFVDQMPKDVRSSLKVKDDDWRLSFIMGNYITLTNVTEAEFQRILDRHAGPLYVSVHATEPELRCRIMGNSTAGKLMERLKRLQAAGIGFHCQIVLCPGLNDGQQLARTLRDLVDLAPACGSVALVPVGLTRYREGLTPLRPYTGEEAAALIDSIAPLREQCLKTLGTRFVHLSDEWYLLAGRNLPPYEEYEDFPQIENGVGLLRLFEAEFLEALEEQSPLKVPVRVSFAGGEAAYPFFRELYKKLLPYGISCELFPVKNRYFGGNVKVGGLITGEDLAAATEGRIETPLLLIPKRMLRETEDVFLDGLTLAGLSERLGVRILAFEDGTDLIERLFKEVMPS